MKCIKAVVIVNCPWLQYVNLRYNIRGQLLNINNSKLANDGGMTSNETTDVFGMQMLYNTTDNNLGASGNTPYYNGKLSAVKWMTKDAGGNDDNERAYMFHYDRDDRYIGEIYAERATANTGAFMVTHGWDERSITYDAGGNLQTLSRNSSTQGFGSNTLIDSLTYSYSTTIPNQLASVHDETGNSAGFVGGTGTYTYDANGNLTNEPYKGIAKISYNVLNRTDSLKLSSTQYITYIYDAGGNLIRKMAYKSGTTTQETDYIGGFVYTNTGGTESLSYFPMPEGRVMYSGGAFTQEFVITDPQGNARVSFHNNGSGVAVVDQETSYYGLGYQLAGSLVTPPATPNKQQYNGGSE
jgi:hypothetical protein